MPSASIVSLHGIKMAAFVQSWSVTVRIVSYPLDVGSLMIKSKAMVWNGNALGIGNMGCTAGHVGWVFTLFIWQGAHPFMYWVMNVVISGHQ